MAEIAIMGVDIGSRKVSVAWSEAWISKDVIYLNGISVRSYETDLIDPAAGLAEVANWIMDSFRPERDTVAFVEEPPYVRNMRVFLKLGMMYGMLLATLKNQGMEVMGVEPPVWKKEIVGKGNASKAEVQQVITEWMPMPLDHLKEDEFDAMAIMRYGVDLVTRARRLTENVLMP